MPLGFEGLRQVPAYPKWVFGLLQGFPQLLVKGLKASVLRARFKHRRPTSEAGRKQASFLAALRGVAKN